MRFFAILLLLANTALGIVVSGVGIMLITLFLHNSWWESLPALDFGQSMLIGLLFGCFQLATSLTESQTSLQVAVINTVVAIILVPLLLPWVVDVINNDLIMAMPDIDYGTSLLFTIIGLGVSIPAALLVAFSHSINESIN
jgi:hypothetical protein